MQSRVQVPVSQPFKFPCNKKTNKQKKHLKTWNVVACEGSPDKAGRR